MAKLTESYLRGMIKQVMNEMAQKPFKNLVSTIPPSGPEAWKNQGLENYKPKKTAFDDEYFKEGKPWEEAMMNLETMVSSYETDGMASPDDLVQAADDLEALLPSVPRSKKQDVRSLIAAAHEQLAEYQPMPNYIPGGSGAKDPQLSPTMDEARKRKLAPKRR
jgi:hypothetical protein